MIGEIVEFDAFDLAEIAMFAERRYSFKVATNATTKRYDQNKSEFELVYVGAMGEKAVSKRYYAELDRSIHLGGDNGTDVVIAGWSCEIKSNTYTGRDFNVFLDGMHCFNADVLISCQILSPVKVRIVGCIGRPRFQKIAQTRNYGYGDRLFVTEQDLIPVDTLYNHPK